MPADRLFREDIILVGLIEPASEKSEYDLGP